MFLCLKHIEDLPISIPNFQSLNVGLPDFEGKYIIREGKQFTTVDGRNPAPPGMVKTQSSSCAGFCPSTVGPGFRIRNILSIRITII